MSVDDGRADGRIPVHHRPAPNPESSGYGVEGARAAYLFPQLRPVALKTYDTIKWRGS